LRATFPIAPGRVSGPITPTPRGARGYGLGALGGVGCVERACFTGCLGFAPQGRHSPSGHREAPSWRVTRRAPRHSPHHHPEPGRQEFLKVHPRPEGARLSVVKLSWMCASLASGKPMPPGANSRAETMMPHPWGHPSGEGSPEGVEPAPFRAGSPQRAQGA